MRCPAVALTASALLLAAAPASASAAGTPGWLSPPLTLTTDTTTADAVTALSPDGTITAAWSTGTSNHHSVVVTTRSPGGPVGPPVTVSTGADATAPTLAAEPDGAVLLAYVQDGGITLARRAAGATAFITTDAVPGNTLSDSPVLAVAPDGTSAALAWRQGRDVSGGAGPHAARLNGEGGLVGLSPPADSAALGSVRLAVGPRGSLGLCWNDALGNRTGTLTVSCASAAPGAPAFATPTRLDHVDNVTDNSGSSPVTSSGSLSPVDVTLDGNARVVAVWSLMTEVDNPDSSDPYVFSAAVRSSSGAAGSPLPAAQDVERDDTDNDALQDASVVLDGAGTAVAAWAHAVRSPSGSLAFRSIETATQPAGGSFEPPQTLVVTFGSQGADALRLPVQARLADGSTMVAYAKGLDTATTQLFAVTRPQGAATGFGSSQPVGASTSGAFSPRFALHADPRGDAILSMNDGSLHPEVHVFDATGPELGAPTVPAGGAPGQSLAFAATPVDAFQSATATFDFGDGSAAVTAPSVSHAYAAAGTYTVRVTAVDPFGLEATPVLSTVTIAAPGGGSGGSGGGGGGGGAGGGGTNDGGGASSGGGADGGGGGGALGGDRCQPVGCDRVSSRALKGLSLTGATTALKAARCAIGKVTKPTAAQRRRHRGPLVVRAQSPRAGCACAPARRSR